MGRWDSGRHPATNAPVPFGVGVACGIVRDFDNMEKFGHCSEMDTITPPAEIWGGAEPDVAGEAEYVFTDGEVGALYYISSTDASDTQEMIVQGLTIDAEGTWNEEIVTVTLAGQTKTQLVSDSGDPWVRVYRAVNNNSSDIAGNVYVYEDDTVTGGEPDTDSKVRLVVIDGDNQTEMCVYTVPETIVLNGERRTVKCGVFMGGYVGISKATNAAAGAEFTWRARPRGGVFAVKGRVQCQNDGSSWWSYKYTTAGVAVPPGTDVALRVVRVTANDTGVVGGFGIYIRT